MIKKVFKWLKRIVLSILVLVVLVFGFGLYAMNAMGQTGEKALDELYESGANPTVFLLEHNEAEINTVSVGNPTNQKILFIHGSPGDWSAWNDFLQDSSLRDSFFMVSYDRCGYGNTTHGAQAELENHGESAKAIIDQFGKDEKWIIVGHSYGGAVVAYLLAKYPERIKRAVLAAGAVAPDFQEPRWYNKIARMKLINKLIGNDMRSSNVEMIGLAPSLRDIEEFYSDNKVHQVFIQGRRDVLVSYRSTDYWKSFEMENVSYVLRENMNHFIPWSNPELIFDAIWGRESE
ncbi:MAG: alpha/beta hydrolase [Bacteroidia bacterium]